ncbi:MAG TPA: alpha/beta fold hydrolase [Xanthomonadaceae bacterium]|nr:alpha/beta fold hydrolase [Xanthomonadaceae bacterium]
MKSTTLPALLVPALLLTLPMAAHAQRLGELGFEPCVLTAVGLPRPTEAQCTSIAVPENPADPDGRQIELALAWIPVDGEAEPDPVFFIAGGPGQSARDSYPMVAPAFDDVHRARHILLLDQRGTGGSHPLDCEDSEETEAAFGMEEFSPERVRAFTERCRATLAEKADLRFYGTAEAVADLDRVRRLVGAEQVNLIGVSYGTRVAQQYAKTHPTHTRTVVLDSVVPDSLPLGNEHARNLQDALEAHFARCRETPACAAAFADPTEKLAAARARFREGAQAEVRYREPTSGEWIDEAPTVHQLSAVLRMYAYTPLTASLLPLLVHQSASGDDTAILAMARMMLRDIGGQMAFGMQLSVICTEDADELARDPANADTLLGDAFIDLLETQCAVWPRGVRAAHFREPLAGALPVLLISGEFDPVTPPRYGDEVAAHLDNARHLVLKGQGHSLLTAGCMPKLLAQFIERAEARGLDAECLDRLAAPPPFSGLYGWEP